MSNRLSYHALPGQEASSIELVPTLSSDRPDFQHHYSEVSSTSPSIAENPIKSQQHGHGIDDTGEALSYERKNPVLDYSPSGIPLHSSDHPNPILYSTKKRSATATSGVTLLGDRGVLWRTVFGPLMLACYLALGLAIYVSFDFCFRPRIRDANILPNPV
jgi:hypothetical protein